MIYVVFSFLSTFSVILLILSFRKDFKTLNITQRISIILTSIAVLIPFIIGTIQGFIGN